jgi:hypothetical protein
VNVGYVRGMDGVQGRKFRGAYAASRLRNIRTSP